jgi:hypothetical protein
VAFSGDGRRIASADRNGMVAVWEAGPALERSPTPR